MSTSNSLIIGDASPLISFLKISRFELLDVLGTQIACTDFVRAEIISHREQLDALLAENRIQEIPITDPNMLLKIEELYARGLGRGEASSLLLASEQGHGLILDDKRARKEASRRQISLYSTTDIILRNIQVGNISVEEADELILLWNSLGEFPVSCKSFADLID